MKILLQTFQDPVWTVSEVGHVYFFIFIMTILLVIVFINSFIDALKDIVTFFKWSIKKIKTKLFPKKEIELPDDTDVTEEWQEWIKRNVR